MTELHHYQSYSLHLTSLQQKYCDESTLFLTKLRKSYEPYFHYYTNAEQEARDHHDDPHPKKIIRMQAMDELIQTSKIFETNWTDHVLYKMKKDEWAKPGKYPRMIGDLGVHASLAGFRVTDFLKVAESYEPTIENEIEIQFIKSPQQNVLRDTFSKLLNPPLRGYFCYFSDDSCFSIKVGNAIYTFNIDISSCDASHTRAIFNALVEVTPDVAKTDIQTLVKQLETPILLRSVANPKNQVLLATTGPKLYSGSTLTTRINNLACQLIGKSLSETSFDGCSSHDDIKTIIIQAAEQVGYQVTCEACPHYSQIQFLKHSPIFDSENLLQPFLNLGVLLRLSGVCKRDLPGRGDLRERARLFQHSLLMGVYPSISFDLIDDMRNSVAGDGAKGRTETHITSQITNILNYKVVTDSSDQPFRVTMEELNLRYPNVSTDEMCELVQDMGTAKFGVALACSAASKILHKDYGLICPR